MNITFCVWLLGFSTGVGKLLLQVPYQACIYNVVVIYKFYIYIYSKKLLPVYIKFSQKTAKKPPKNKQPTPKLQPHSCLPSCFHTTMAELNSCGRNYMV